MNGIYSYIVFFIAAFASSNVFASDIIVLTDQSEEYVVSNTTIDILRDSTKAMTFDQVVAQYAARPGSFSVKSIQVNDPGSAFWIRFRIKDLSSHSKNWLLELYDIIHPVVV